MTNEKSLWVNWKDEKIAKRELEAGRITLEPWPIMLGIWFYATILCKGMEMN